LKTCFFQDGVIDLQEAIMICSVKILYAAVVVVELLELAWVSEGTLNSCLGVKYGNKNLTPELQ
jgi:hypothetical protein